VYVRILTTVPYICQQLADVGLFANRDSPSPGARGVIHGELQAFGFREP